MQADYLADFTGAGFLSRKEEGSLDWRADVLMMTGISRR